MKKVILRTLVVIALVVSAISWVLFLNSHLEFLPDKITVAVDDFCYKLFNKEDDIGTIDTSDYVLLSTLLDSPLLEKMDLSVPNDTYIPSEEEISKTYSGLYSDSIVATRANYDIIIQNYGIEIAAEIELTEFREKLVRSLQTSRPDISFDTSHTIKKGDLEIPVVEFSTEYEGRSTHSFIALVDVDGNLITVAMNSTDPYVNAVQFFNTLIDNMVIK